MSDEGFVGRWSRKKREATALTRERLAAPEPMAPPAANASQGQGAVAASPAPVPDPNALPPLESLTPHSDFSAFLRPGVEPATRAQALKTLFSDATLYPMDRLDVYIDDYSKPDPLPEGWLEKLNQFAALDEIPAAEAEARRKEQEAKDAAAAPAPAAPEPSIEPVERVAEAAPGTAEAPGASDPLAPGDLHADTKHRDPI